MTTSGLITSALTAADYTRLAMEELGLLSSGETPTPEESATGVERLNWMLKTWQAKGCNLWRDTTATATFGATVATVTLSPRPITVTDARIVMTATYERELARWEAGDYRSIPNKAAAGIPTIYVATQGRDATTMTLWPVPVAETTVSYAYARTIEDVTDPGETLDVPQEWGETVWMGLAMRLANTFGAARLDPAAVDRVTAMAGALEELLLNNDRPASITMRSARATRRY